MKTDELFTRATIHIGKLTIFIIGDDPQLVSSP